MLDALAERGLDQCFGLLVLGFAEHQATGAKRWFTIRGERLCLVVVIDGLVDMVADLGRLSQQHVGFFTRLDHAFAHAFFQHLRGLGGVGCRVIAVLAGDQIQLGQVHIVRFLGQLARSASLLHQLDGFRVLVCLHQHGHGVVQRVGVVWIGVELVGCQSGSLVVLAGLGVAGHQNLVPARFCLGAQRLGLGDRGNRVGIFGQAVVRIAFECVRVGRFLLAIGAPLGNGVQRRLVLLIGQLELGEHVLELEVGVVRHDTDGE